MLSYGHDPKWLTFLSRRLRWMAIPNIAMAFVALQAIGYMAVITDSSWFNRLALLPDLAVQGEYWRFFSFLTLPLSLGLIGILFAVFFGFLILNSIENEWGSFKTTFYVLSSIVLTVVFSLIFNYPVTSLRGFVSTWFLAAATLFPERQIHLYMLVPVKMKYLGWFAAVFILIEFIRGSWLDRFYLITLYFNYLLFFGPYVINSIKLWDRRRRFKSQWR